MRAVALAQPGGRVLVTELPEPEPAPGEIVVRVRAASINPIDVRISTGQYPWGKFDYPVVPGFDFAGVIEDCGGDVNRLRPGDEVLGYWNARRFHRGSWAEYVAVAQEGMVVRKPAGMSFADAAAVPLAAVTALQCVDAVLPLDGQPVLIVGAGGAVGRYAVQVAAAAGATVLATGRPEQEERLREHGAAEVIDHRRNELSAVVGESYPDGIAALVDLANDPAGVARLSTLVRGGGRLASACFGADPQALARRGITADNVVATHADPSLLERVIGLVEAGTLHVGYNERRPLEEVPAAVEEISSGPSRKTVIDIGGA